MCVHLVYAIFLPGDHKLVFKKYNKKIVIKHKESNSFITVRIWRNQYISLIIRSNHGVFKNSQGTLVEGCSDTINVADGRRNYVQDTSLFTNFIAPLSLSFRLYCIHTLLFYVLNI